MSGTSPLPDIAIIDECNYIAAFLAMACPYRCSYCINEFESVRPRWRIMPAEDWIRALSRLTNLERAEGAENLDTVGFFNLPQGKNLRPQCFD